MFIRPLSCTLRKRIEFVKAGPFIQNLFRVGSHKFNPRLLIMRKKTVASVDSRLRGPSTTYFLCKFAYLLNHVDALLFLKTVAHKYYFSVRWHSKNPPAISEHTAK